METSGSFKRAMAVTLLAVAVLGFTLVAPIVVSAVYVTEMFDAPSWVALPFAVGLSVVIVAYAEKLNREHDTDALGILAEEASPEELPDVSRGDYGVTLDYGDRPWDEWRDDFELLSQLSRTHPPVEERRRRLLALDPDAVRVERNGEKRER